MLQIFEATIQQLLEQDYNGDYKKSLSELSSKYSRLMKYKNASLNKADPIVLEACEIVLQTISKVDALYKQSNFDKESGFITNIMIKTLEVAQKLLSTLLVKSPMKVGVAYNAMHNVIKFLRKEMKK